jgi:hypothetical protein
MVVVVSVRVIGWANIVHLVGGSTLHAARLGLLASEGDPENAVGVDGKAGAADVLLVTGRVDDNGVLWGACTALENCPASPTHSSLHFWCDCNVPRRLASNGLMSKMSIPCIFPSTSRRSRPVACSASVGTVPGWAPGGRRSSMLLISVAKLY